IALLQECERRRKERKSAVRGILQSFHGRSFRMAERGAVRRRNEWNGKDDKQIRREGGRDPGLTPRGRTEERCGKKCERRDIEQRIALGIAEQCKEQRRDDDEERKDHDRFILLPEAPPHRSRVNERKDKEHIRHPDRVRNENCEVLRKAAGKRRGIAKHMEPRAETAHGVRARHEPYKRS